MNKLPLYLLAAVAVLLYLIFRRPIAIDIDGLSPEERWARGRVKRIVMR